MPPPRDGGARGNGAGAQTALATTSNALALSTTDAMGGQAPRAKNARIRAEEDGQLLQNRINRLIIEEEKAAKRIAETRQGNLGPEAS